MKKRLNTKQEGIIENIKKTQSNLKLIDHNEYANLWNPKDFPVSNPHRFYRGIQSKVEQSFHDFHYAFSPLPDSYKTKILTSRAFEDFMNTIKQFANQVDGKESEDPEDSFSFMMYYNFFNMGTEGLIKLLPEEFKWHIREQLRDALLLMQSIARFTQKSGSKRQVPFIHAPDSLLAKGFPADLE